MKSSEKPPTRPAPEGALDATLPGSSLPDPAVSTAREPAASTARTPAVSTARNPVVSSEGRPASTARNPVVSSEGRPVSTARNPVVSSEGRPVSTARNPPSSSDPDPAVSTSREPDDDIDPALESTIHVTDVSSSRRHEPPPAARVASSAPAGTRISSSDAPSLAQTRESGPTGVGPAFTPGGSSDRPTAFGATLAVGAEDDTVRTDVPGAALLLDQELPVERYGAAEALAAGGMGEVAVLGDRWIGREVAKKSMRPEIAGSSNALARFLREIRVQGQLEHPSIVPVYDVGRTDGGELYFTMRRIQGMTLADVLDGITRGDEQLTARFSRRKLLTAFSSVCMTVHYAHSRGVVHRDLKPSNIMLGAYGEVYVLDWGIAKLVEGGQEPRRPAARWGRSATCPPSRRAAGRSTRAPTCTRSASSCSRSSRGSTSSRACARSR